MISLIEKITTEFNLSDYKDLIGRMDIDELNRELFNLRKELNSCPKLKLCDLNRAKIILIRLEEKRRDSILREVRKC